MGEINTLTEALAHEKRKYNQDKRKSLSLNKDYEILQKQLQRERERSQRLLSENTDLVGKTKRLESVLRSERLDSATKESCLKRSTANLQRELDMQKDEINRTKRNFEKVLERNLPPIVSIDGT